MVLGPHLKNLIMKTKMKSIALPEAITSIPEAKSFMKLLHENGLSYHPEDDASDCLEGLVSKANCKKINKLMNDIYEMKGNESPQSMIFDPCWFSLILDDDYRSRTLIDFLEGFDNTSSIGDAVRIALYHGDTKHMIMLLNELHPQMGTNPSLFKGIFGDVLFNNIMSLHV